MKNKRSVSMQIVSSLFSLMGDQPYATIRVKQICKRAHISRMTYYRHFRSKASVIDYSLDTDFTVFIQRVASLHFPSFVEIATVFFELVKQRRAELQLIFRDRLDRLLLDRLKYYLRSLIDQRVLRTREQSSELLVAMVAGGLTEILATWIQNGTRIPVASLVIFVSKYLHFRA